LTTQIVAAILIWMGTGGELKHTDDLSALMSFPAAAHHPASISAAGKVTVAGDDDCAACRWAVTSSDMLVAPPIVAAVSVMHVELPQALPASVRTAPILHANFRAPPTSIV
jgi:hypothetical protein